MKLVKDCPHRAKDGQCQKWDHRCCFSPNAQVVCIANKPKKRRSRKK